MINHLPVSPNERYPEFNDHHFIEAVKKAKAVPTHKEDVRFFERHMALYFERIFKEGGKWNIGAEIKKVSLVYFHLRPKSHYDLSVSQGKHKGFFRQLLGMDKKRVTSDYRIALVYILSMHVWMQQRQHFVRKYCDANGIKQEDRRLPIPDELVPSQEYFKDYGIDYWVACGIEAVNHYNRNTIILRTTAEFSDEKEDMIMYVDRDGEITYCLNASINIKPKDGTLLQTLRGKVMK